MVSQIKPMVEQMGVNVWLFNTALKDMAIEHVIIRPRDKGNSILWNAGHVTTSRYFLGNILGLEAKHPWGELFDRGQSIVEDDKYPSIEEIKSGFEDITGKLMARFEAITDEELKAEHGYSFPIQDKTRKGAITFLSLHESYHMGQFSYIRRLLGLDGLTG